MFCNKFPSILLTLHLSLAKILGKVFNFITPQYPDIIKVWLAKNSFWYHSPSKYYREKTVGGENDPRLPGMAARL